MPLTSAATAPDTPASTRSGAVINRLAATAYTFPTDRPESDGTFAWDSTTIVIAEIDAGGATGLGYTYASEVAAPLIVNALATDVLGADPLDIPSVAHALSVRLRNAGRPGIGATAISAVDNALWDVKARLLDLPLIELLGARREAVPAYGSGGFTSYPADVLHSQLADWAEAGFRMVKIKIGRHREQDPDRVRVSRDAIGDDVELFVDANGAFDPRSAVSAARWLGDADVRWFEEPVSSDHLDGLRFVRDHAPAGMAIAAGEYAWTPIDFIRLADGPAVDVIQADATRCLGISGFLEAAAICHSRGIPMSSHCAPSLHVSACCAVAPVVHMEWFHDHVRLERAFFDGAACADHGLVAPHRSKPGLGLDLKRRDVEQYLVWHGEATR